LEERLLTDDALMEQLSLIEDELIEDYARNALSANDRKQFERLFIKNPRRRRKLMFVRGLRKYTVDVGHVRTADRSPARGWPLRLLSPQWAPVGAVVLILLGSIFVWQLYFRRSDVDKGLLALNEAYKQKRPVEARVTGLNYAPFSETRGPSYVNSRELDRSAALLHNAVDEKSSADAIHALGRLYLLNREFDKAVLEFEEALKKTPNDAKLHSDLGAALLEKGKVERASDQSGRSETTLASSLEHLKRALELDDSLLDARFNRALLYEQMRLTPQALADWEKYLTLDPNSRWADEARKKIKEIKEQGQKVSQRNEDLAPQFFDARRAGDREKMWQVFSNAHLRTGNAVTNKLIDNYLLTSTTPERSEEAAESLNTLIDLGKLAGDKTGDRFTADVAEAYRSATPSELKSFSQARTDAATAYDFYNQSKHDLAIPLYNRARDTFAAAANPEGLLARFWLSYCFLQRGDTQNSIAVLQAVERECETHNYEWLLSLTQVGLANAWNRQTKYSQAVDYGWASYNISQQLADKNGEIRSLNLLASLYRDMGNYRRSLYTAQQGLRLGSEISADASQMIGFYATSAWSFNSLGHYPAALEYETEALNLSEVMNSPLVHSRYLVQMGLIQGMLKNYDEAIRNINLGIEVGRSLGEQTISHEMSTVGRLYLGQAYRESGRYPEALATLTDAENFCRQKTGEQLWLLHEVKKEQLLTRIAQRDFASAGDELAQVLNDYEDQRQKIQEESNRKSFFDKEQGIYDVAIDFAYSQASDPQRAFDYSETSRARSLLDTSTEDWHVADEEKIPDLRFSSAVKPMPLTEIRQNLPDRAQVLQFAVLKEKLVIWYLTRDRFESATVSVSSDELMDKVDRLLSLVTHAASDSDKQLQRISGELFDLLIKPLAQFLDPQKQLCIVPDKILNLLPFNVLFSSSTQRYLLEDFALSYASSANLFVRESKLANEKSTATNEEFLGVGNPLFDRKAFPDLADLPSASREVENVSHFYDRSLLLRDGDAKKASVLSEMRNADVLHFATHYLPDATSPMLSKLVLARELDGQGRPLVTDEVLHAYEIYRLKPLRSRLAILAGCQTGVEAYVNGEGPIGLARPFNAAGVPLVIASLWPVDSQATTELMIEFHRLRRQNHYSSAEALRGAQLQMLRQENTSHRNAYYWASFSLIGGYSDY